MKKVMFILLAVVIFASLAMAQGVTAGTATSKGAGGSAAPTVDVLGAHNNYGRGCAGCHAPHSGARGNGGNGVNGTVVDTQTGENALFGQDYGPLYGQTLNFGDIKNVAGSAGTNYQLITPAAGTQLQALSSQQYSDLRGIIMCLACHDGNVAKGAMMQNQAYEQQIGALPTSYGTGHIPTLLGNNGVGAGIYNNDHPVGEQALITSAGVPSAALPVNGTMTTTSVAGSASYALFVASYGAPALLPGAHSSPTPLTAANLPYVVCTTCHNQHVMNIFAASATNPIAGSATGTYATYFFINGPYNVNDVTSHSTSANSTTQFCRQCHFGEANESNGGTLPTSF